MNLRTGKTTLLPGGAKATALALSPRGTAIYFVLIPTAKPLADQTLAPANAFESSPPYLRGKAIPVLRAQAPFSWHDALSFNQQILRRPHARDQSFEAAQNDAWKSRCARSQTRLLDANPNHSSRHQLRSHARFVRRAPSRTDVCRAPSRQTPEEPRRPYTTDDELADEFAKDMKNWQLSDPALSPDGSRLVFASNAGTGCGAQGNGMFALFAVDLRTNRLAVMSKVGENFGRPPHIFRVSPDGKRLLLASRVHSSAADNSYFVQVVDLLTQNSREVFSGVLPNSKKEASANFLDSAVWSPDSKDVALSGYFYDAQKATTDKNGDWPEVLPSQYTAGIVDAATGHLVKTIKGATSLSWAR